MEYIHVRNLEKYHPGYKDRTLQWAKIYINMASGDPDTELLDEIDWSRLIKIILLELRAQKPVPNLDTYWLKNGMDIKKRPMSLTIKMLHNFLDTVTQDSKLCHVDKEKEEDKDIRYKIKSVFTQPTQEECITFFSINNSNELNARNFFDHYSSNGWKVGGRTPMKDWQAAARKWIRNSGQFTHNQKNNDSYMTKSQKHAIEGLKKMREKNNVEPTSIREIGVTDSNIIS